MGSVDRSAAGHLDAPHPNHQFVKAVSRLSDGVVELDPVEELLVALGRAGILTSYQRGLLQVHYLR